MNPTASAIFLLDNYLFRHIALIQPPVVRDCDMLKKVLNYFQIYKIREEYLKAVLNQDFAYFDLNKTGDFASKMAE